MKINTYLLLFALFPFAIVGCAGKRTLTKHNVVTRYTTAAGQNTWTGAETRQKIPLKKLRILLVNQTETPHTHSFEKPQAMSFRDYSMPLQLDTAIQSQFYNRFVLKKIKERIPLKARVDVYESPVTQATLDSLLQTDAYDAILSAKEIALHLSLADCGINAEALEYRNKNMSRTTSNISHISYPGLFPHKEMFDIDIHEIDVMHRDVSIESQTKWLLMKRKGDHYTEATIQQTGVTSQLFKEFDLYTDNVFDEICYLIEEAAVIAGNSFYEIFMWK